MIATGKRARKMFGTRAEAKGHKRHTKKAHKKFQVVPHIKTYLGKVKGGGIS